MSRSCQVKLEGKKNLGKGIYIYKGIFRMLQSFQKTEADAQKVG